MSTGIRWIDDIVERANFQKTVDREGAALVLGQLMGDLPSVHTVRQWPIPYTVIGRSARYKVDDLIAYARKRLDEARPRSGYRPGKQIQTP